MKLLIKRSYCLFILLFSINSIAEVEKETPITLTGSVDYQSQLGQVLGVLLFILLLIFSAAWLMKKFGFNGSTLNSGLSVKACLPLSNKEKLYVIQVGNEQVLIGVAAGSITALKTLEEPIDHDIQAINSNSPFSKMLQDIIATKKNKTNNNASDIAL